MTATARPKALRTFRAFRQLGPGLVTGAADDDPSGIATYSQTGAQFGYGLLWTLVLTYPLMAAVQLISAHIGRVTGCGLAMNLRAVFPRKAVMALVGLLFVANTINIGADVAAMGEAAELMVGFGRHGFTIAFALVSLTLQVLVPYRRYANYLKWLTMALLSYVALVFMVKLQWHDVLHGLLVPSISGREALVAVVALLGTTISPYLFFWQAAQEVEEIAQGHQDKPLTEAPNAADKEFRRMRLDTLFGMAVSNIVALAIMIGTAATLHASGHTEINSAAEAAAALKPVAGSAAFTLFGLGIIGTGLLAVPVLAGSAAYAIGEAMGWTCGLEHKPGEASRFYGVIAAATVLGIAIDWSPIAPMKALFWSSVVNGVVAVPVMIAMMLLVSKPAVMGQFTAGPALRRVGWTATLVMVAASLSLFFAMSGT